MATRGVLQRDNARKNKRKQPVSPVSNQRTMDDKFKKQNDILTKFLPLNADSHRVNKTDEKTRTLLDNYVKLHREVIANPNYKPADKNLA